ncbi:alpha/beta fold hydrolase [Stenotrophobium rhamnosiphilum]|uniref:Alpha/beta hydrolase n=1 Tax=Stenotrophobium rhamnosiphilum TaxID=2029166 RepID=A0A2T5MH02_9GAMM|nr:alpha/beta hydrolase [Stenotrophobium rhamnosiphilum]PTU31856.1 alpha/beta hydrolase [Stenotrophobium rhamnosiphilum]
MNKPISSYPDALPFPEVYEGGAGTPLVLIHGFGGNWRMWKPVLSILEKHHRVIVPTLPGHSGGLPLTQKVSPGAVADALAAQLRARGLDQAHVVGQSLGGYMAIEMARRGVARSVLAISSGGAWKDDARMAKTIKQIRAIFKVMPYLKGPLSLLLGIKALRKLFLSGDMEHGNRMSAKEARGMVHHGLNCPIALEFLSGVLPQVESLPADNKTPISVVWCEKDSVLPFDEFGQPFLDRFGLKTHGVLVGCGHLPMYDDPEAVAATILENIRDVEGRKT